MAVHTKHPIAAPPTAPLREKTRHLLLRGWCVFVLFQAFGGVGMVNALGTFTASAIALISALISVGVWISARPVLNWRRLPWFPLGYVAWALLSVIWSAWSGTSALTWLLLVVTTLQGILVAAVLTWREILRALASALAWVMALSLGFELWVSWAIGGPLLPGFVVPQEKMDPIVYWSRDNLFDGGRIQGIFGNANLLAAVALIAIIVFAIVYAMPATRRPMPLVWCALAAFLFVRAESATAYVAAAAVAVVLTTVLLMRTATRPGARTKYYIGYAAVGAAGMSVLWFGREAIFTALGRSSDLTGRETIWNTVMEKAWQHPLVGNGFASPWIASDPFFEGWIIDHGETVVQAHNMWVDVFFQLGAVGLIIMAGIYGSFVWRAWFFAVDRPRWDLEAHRPYSALTLLPTLTVTVLLIQGLAESGPLLLWGWMMLVLLGTKIKQAPLLGVGPAEHVLAIERGESVDRTKNGS